jgi:hypothetical protein
VRKENADGVEVANITPAEFFEFRRRAGEKPRQWNFASNRNTGGLQYRLTTARWDIPEYEVREDVDVRLEDWNEVMGPVIVEPRRYRIKTPQEMRIGEPYVSRYNHGAGAQDSEQDKIDTLAKVRGWKPLGPSGVFTETSMIDSHTKNYWKYFVVDATEERRGSEVFEEPRLSATEVLDELITHEVAVENSTAKLRTAIDQLTKRLSDQELKISFQTGQIRALDAQRQDDARMVLAAVSFGLWWRWIALTFPPRKFGDDIEIYDAPVVRVGR